MGTASRAGQHSGPAHLQSDPQLDQDGNKNVDGSQSATTCVKEEPFKILQSRVLVLARETIWPAANPADIQVDDTDGGSFNRVVGVTNLAIEASPIQTIPRHQIVRVPRQAHRKGQTIDIEDDVAVMMFVKSHDTIPVPRVLSYAMECDNPIQEPYVVLERLPGRTVWKDYHVMSHEQRIKMAAELGTYYRRMLAIQSTQAGKIIFAPGATDKFALYPLTMEQAPPTDDNDKPTPKPFVSGPAGETVHQWLTGILRAEAVSASDRYPEQPWRANVMELFCQMVDELQSKGLLDDVQYCLAHRDFAARNILVDIASDDRLITGILDWDMALLVPEFVACKPPCWLWRWIEDRNGGTRMQTLEETWIEEEPSTAHGRDVKHAF